MAIGEARRVRGFTLLELLVVLAVIALVSVALPFAANRALPGRALDLAVTQLVDDLRMLRRAAAVSGKPTSLVASESGYQAGARTRHFRSGMTFAVEGVLRAGPLATLDIYPDGSSAGAIMTLALGTRTRQVRVNPLTGEIREASTQGTP